MNLKWFLAAGKKKTQPTKLLYWLHFMLSYSEIGLHRAEQKYERFFLGGGATLKNSRLQLCRIQRNTGHNLNLGRRKKIAHYILIKPTATLSSTTLTNKGWGKQFGASKKNGKLYSIKCQKTTEGKDFKTKNCSIKLAMSANLSVQIIFGAKTNLMCSMDPHPTHSFPKHSHFVHHDKEETSLSLNITLQCN